MASRRLDAAATVAADRMGGMLQAAHDGAVIQAEDADRTAQHARDSADVQRADAVLTQQHAAETNMNVTAAALG